MRSVRLLLLPLALSAVVAVQAAGQSVVSPGDVAIVTADGFWRLLGGSPQSQPVNHLAPSAFDPGFGTLSIPRIDWERGTDGFLVSTGSDVYRVTVTSALTATITDLTPNVGGPATFTELDIHPGTGELYLFDQSSQLVFRFDPPFALNMAPDLVLSTGSGYRAFCVDSRQYPPSVTIATNSVMNRLPLDGSAPIAVASTGAGALDGSPQYKFTVFVNDGQHLVNLTTPTPELTIELNAMFGCIGQVALGPTAVADYSAASYARVLARDGVNAFCFPGATGGNHVVLLPPALNPSVPPLLITDPSGSGISGGNGDLCVVTGDFAFPSPYGFGCDAPSTGKPAVLDCNFPPFIGFTGFELEISDALPNTAIYLVFGFQPLSQSQPNGCTALVLAYQPATFIGTTNANGKLTVTYTIPPTTPPGSQVYLQCAFADSGTRLTNGLLLHFGTF